MTPTNWIVADTDGKDIAIVMMSDGNYGTVVLNVRQAVTFASNLLKLCGEAKQTNVVESIPE